MTKFCIYCNNEKPIEGFKKWNRRCYECRQIQRKEILEEKNKDKDYIEKHRKSARDYYHNNKEKVKNNRFLVEYGISIKEYEFLLELQNGVCAICKRKERAKKTNGKEIKALAVDHCHKTGEVRGLLCHGCNTGLGAFEENPNFISKALDYLEDK